MGGPLGAEQAAACARLDFVSLFGMGWTDPEDGRVHTLVPCRSLAPRRLLHGTSASEDHEKSVLTRLKQQCGAQFTSKVGAGRGGAGRGGRGQEGGQACGVLGWGTGRGHRDRVAGAYMQACKATGQVVHSFTSAALSFLR